MNNRDDFSDKIKQILKDRVGGRCSNPDCQKETVWPNSESDKRTNIGVAAHITAAAPGGPRYDAKLTSKERVSADNGIWLCYNCSVMIDNDKNQYTKEILLNWKNVAEKSQLERALQWPANVKCRTIAIKKISEDLFKFMTILETAYKYYKKSFEHFSSTELERSLTENLDFYKPVISQFREFDNYKNMVRCNLAEYNLDINEDLLQAIIEFIEKTDFYYEEDCFNRNTYWYRFFEMVKDKYPDLRKRYNDTLKLKLRQDYLNNNY